VVGFIRLSLILPPLWIHHSYLYIVRHLLVSFVIYFIHEEARKQRLLGCDRKCFRLCRRAVSYFLTWDTWSIFFQCHTPYFAGRALIERSGGAVGLTTRLFFSCSCCRSRCWKTILYVANTHYDPNCTPFSCSFAIL
jgi:hypothetical protein